jgi:hypothetical protein
LGFPGLRRVLWEAKAPLRHFSSIFGKPDLPHHYDVYAAACSKFYGDAAEFNGSGGGFYFLDVGIGQDMLPEPPSCSAPPQTELYFPQAPEISIRYLYAGMKQ